MCSPRAAKPLACRIYPFLLVPAGDHWNLGLRMACPSAADNKGGPLADHLREARDFAALLEQAAAGANLKLQPEARQMSDGLEAV